MSTDHHALASSSFAQPTRIIASDAEALQIAQDIARQLAPGACERDRQRTLPGRELDLLSSSGLLAVTVPRTHGGADVSYATLGRIFQILCAADPAIGQLPQNHFVFLDAIRQDGTPAQKDLFFREVLAGARFGNAQAERGSASALDLNTRLSRRDGSDEYHLNGTKYYCTGAIVAHWIPVAALDDSNRLVLAYVRQNAPGVEVRADWNAMGQRVTFSGTTILNNVAVQSEHIIQHWHLLERASLFHSSASFLHAAIDVGIAQNALDDTASLLRSRKRPRLGAPVEHPLDDPHVLMRFGQLITHFHAAEELLQRAAQLLDSAAPQTNRQNAAEASIAVSEAKAFSEDVAMEITGELFALVGSASTDDELNLHRHWRNARTHTIHDANQWRYHSAGNYFLNGVAPGTPVRRAAQGPSASGSAGASRNTTGSRR
jgi:SfnB family sulfur acquisition oxidoreductase